MSGSACKGDNWCCLKLLQTGPVGLCHATERFSGVAGRVLSGQMRTAAAVASAGGAGARRACELFFSASQLTDWISTSVVSARSARVRHGKRGWGHQ